MLFFEGGELHQLLPEGWAFWNVVAFLLGCFGLVVPFLGPLYPEQTDCGTLVWWYVGCGVIITGGIFGLIFATMATIALIIYQVKKAK